MPPMSDGETVYSASYLPTPLGWKGQSGAYRDSESGLFLMGARYYSPALGRFVGRDPIAFAGGINVYGYCGGDPINYSDPSGLSGVQGLGTTVSEGEVLAPYATQAATDSSLTGAEVAGETVGAVTGEAAAGLTLINTLPVVDIVYDAAFIGCMVWEEQSAATALECAKPVVLAARPNMVRHAQRASNECTKKGLAAEDRSKRSTFPVHTGEPFSRMLHYGRTPTIPQKDIPFQMGCCLITILFWCSTITKGTVSGGIPGYMMTDEDRIDYGKSLNSGRAAPRGAEVWSRG